MQYGQVNGHLIKKPNKTGYSYNFQVTKNQRNKLSGKSEKILVFNFGTVRDDDFDNLAVTVPFWRNVIDTLRELAEEEVINRNCVSEIKAKFEKIIPMPVVSTAPQKLINNEIAERLRKKFPHLFSEEEKGNSAELPLLP